MHHVSNVFNLFVEKKEENARKRTYTYMVHVHIGEIILKAF